MAKIELTLLGKEGCHLCDDARSTIIAVLAEPAIISAGLDLVLTEKSILDDDALFDQFAEEIPVLLINEKVHNYWRIDPDRLRFALLELGK